MMSDTLKIGEFEFRSRLMTGTGKYPSLQIAEEALKASGCEVVTVAIRRVDLNDRSAGSIFDVLRRGGYKILPNTAGCYTAEDALRTARLAREMLDTPLVKLEVIGDEKTLFPDVTQTIEAAKILVREGFVVLPYFTDDPVSAKKLEDAGCAAVMPLAAPIGSGLGIRNPYNIEIIVKHSSVPVIVDAGVGTASVAAIAMELGVDGVLMNTAIAGATDPVRMARAMNLAVQAGRDAYLAGRIERKLYATASSPLRGVIGSDN
ncbi:MAG: thiazole synthase [Polyangiales bacterium]